MERILSDTHDVVVNLVEVEFITLAAPSGERPGTEADRCHLASVEWAGRGEDATDAAARRVIGRRGGTEPRRKVLHAVDGAAVEEGEFMPLRVACLVLGNLEDAVEVTDR